MSWIVASAHAVPVMMESLELEALPRGQRHKLAVGLMEDGAGRTIRIPVVVARGAEPGQTVGVTAAVHGNELNGVRTIHRLMSTVDPARLRGTVVGVPIVNMPAYLANQRKYIDGQDLNRIFPGKPGGNEAEVYAHRFVHRVLNRFDVLLDLHTASFGRVNSLYIRADMTHPDNARMARGIGAEIIVHNEGSDGTLRAAADSLGIPAITIEIGDPQVFDRSMIRTSRIGLRDVLEDLGMMDPDGEQAEGEAVECRRSYWLYTDTGGLLTVFPEVGQRLAEGDPIGRMVNPWGEVVREYTAPEAGVVVGKSTNPTAHTGSRILHLGVIGRVEASAPQE